MTAICSTTEEKCPLGHKMGTFPSRRKISAKFGHKKACFCARKRHSPKRKRHPPERKSTKKGTCRGALNICREEDYISCFSKFLMLTFSSTLLYSSAIGILSCSMVSRSRRVTHLSSSDWWSTVIHNGVPIASWRR